MARWNLSTKSTKLSAWSEKENASGDFVDKNNDYQRTVKQKKIFLVLQALNQPDNLFF